jgi:hypothetical protein
VSPNACKQRGRNNAGKQPGCRPMHARSQGATMQASSQGVTQCTQAARVSRVVVTRHLHKSHNEPKQPEGALQPQHAQRHMHSSTCTPAFGQPHAWRLLTKSLQQLLTTRKNQRGTSCICRPTTTYLERVAQVCLHVVHLHSQPKVSHLGSHTAARAAGALEHDVARLYSDTHTDSTV